MQSPEARTPLDRSADRHLAHRTLIVIGVTAATITLLLLFWYIVDVILLVFAAILLAVLLRAPTDWLTRRLSIPAGLSLTFIVLLLFSLIAIGGWLFGRNVASQMGELVASLPQLIDEVQKRMAEYDWLIQYLRPRQLLGDDTQFVGRGLRVVTTTFGAVASIGIVLLMTIFFAAQPNVYIDGLLRLIPIPRRARAHEVLTEVGHILRRWLLGQLVLMAFVAVLTAIGLWTLGVRFPLALAVLAGLLTFIPYLGPVLAAVPAILVGLADGALLAGYVVLLYAGVQAAEAPLEPIVQQKAVRLPPVLVLFAQVVFGILMGPLGVMLATPLAAAMLVSVRMLYVQDVLGDRSRHVIP